MAALAMVVLLAGMGLVIDGGNAWAQQRITQAGNDAAAEAGALVLAHRLYGLVQTDAAWDAAVSDAISTSAQGNEIDVPVAYYTDICGTLLQPNGSKATTPEAAARVGEGALPEDLSTNPDCPSGSVGPVAGVQVMAQRQFSTYISRVIGIATFTAATSATAATGFLQNCDVASGCTVLPLTVPTFLTTCDHEGDNVTGGTQWPTNETVVVPMCKSTDSSGSVGWLDWPPITGGGVPELLDSIKTPNNPPIDLPSWQYVTMTGDASTSGIQTELERYVGEVVMFPMFDLQCIAKPDDDLVEEADLYGCPEGFIGGNGVNQWYRIPKFASFLLEEVHVSGNADPICKAEGITGGKTPSCLVGKFVDFITGGTIGPGLGGGNTNTSVVGVQLIK